MSSADIDYSTLVNLVCERHGQQVIERLIEMGVLVEALVDGFDAGGATTVAPVGLVEGEIKYTVLVYGISEDHEQS